LSFVRFCSTSGSSVEGESADERVSVARGIHADDLDEVVDRDVAGALGHARACRP
jgi:hypothetical protein